MTEIPEEDTSEVHDITGESKITRSGQVFSPSNPLESSVDASAKVKAKNIMINGGEYMWNPPFPNLNVDIAKDVVELMQYIKKIDYKVIDQLSQTPTKISILALFRDFEPHYNSLMKLLGTSFVPQENSESFRRNCG